MRKQTTILKQNKSHNSRHGIHPLQPMYLLTGKPHSQTFRRGPLTLCVDAIQGTTWVESFPLHSRFERVPSKGRGEGGWRPTSLISVTRWLLV